jgi:biotin synthase
MEAGITRYHHNLETCKSYFPQVCTTHTYDERVKTLIAAKKAGLSICAGGIFGIGETDDHIFELALALRELDIDSVPINFLVPVKGTPFSHLNNLTPLRCLKIIAFFRYFLPSKEIIICGGRENNLGELHTMVFFAGASGIMTGNYLTTKGRTLQKDLRMIDQLGFSTREK